MPSSEGNPAVTADARSFSYHAGAVGPTFTRAIAIEAPIELVIGGSPFAVMMATPTELEDFAYGFLFTEGIVERPGDIRSVDTVESGFGWRLDIALSGEKLKTHFARRRAISGRSGCGLCGVDDLQRLQAPPRSLPSATPVRPEAIGAALAALEFRQPLNALTRAVHGAAWCSLDGRIALIREDVGRHNALDKAIGAVWRAGGDGRAGFFLITSRCSFEMVAKAAIFGAGTLVSLSAPTSLALERARTFGVAVIAVARADGAIAFTDGGAETPRGLIA
ncbi:formate dehydrogenase accessory sulfurtransferase FdhD [Roseiarcus sp.]|uniref:formate dehydrogenase accessory sulfurtransferase FdhD n=1 Tax=Roseiarcus sp. TaxID=1969460 RepID=UPI003F9E8651